MPLNQHLDYYAFFAQDQDELRAELDPGLKMDVDKTADASKGSVNISKQEEDWILSPDNQGQKAASPSRNRKVNFSQDSHDTSKNIKVIDIMKPAMQLTLREKIKAIEKE